MKQLLIITIIFSFSCPIFAWQKFLFWKKSNLIKNIQNNNGIRMFGDGTFASSCNKYKNPNPGYTYSGAIGDGIYRIQINSTTYDVYCLMSYDNTGFVKILQKLPNVNTAVVRTPHSTTQNYITNLPHNVLSSTIVLIKTQLPVAVGNPIQYNTNVMFSTSRNTWFDANLSYSFAYGNMYSQGNGCDNVNPFNGQVENSAFPYFTLAALNSSLPFSEARFYYAEAVTNYCKTYYMNVGTVPLQGQMPDYSWAQDPQTVSTAIDVYARF